jgi:mRNA-degrading endonuclease RelE of RelBE toxin-antitoxin system
LPFHVKVTHKARRELKRLPADRQYQLLKKLKRLEEDPSPDGYTIKEIVQDPNGKLRRLRVGNYRIFFEVEGDEVYVLRCVTRQTLEKAIRQLIQR